MLDFQPLRLVTTPQWPHRTMLLTTVVASGGLMLIVPRAWPLWAQATAGLLAWVPLFAVGTRWTYRRYHWLALFYILVVTQGGHFLEHLSQMVQIHVLGLSGPAASGIFGALNLEEVHFAWNTWVLLATLVLLAHFRTNRWLWLAAVLASWHQVEHTYIFAMYLGTGVQGLPGLLAHGGALWGGLPVVRPDLHFFYNLIETVPLALAFFEEVRRQSRAVHAPWPRAQRPRVIRCRADIHVCPSNRRPFASAVLHLSDGPES